MIKSQVARILAALILSVALLFPAGEAAANALPDHAPGRVIVKFKTDPAARKSPRARARLRAGLGGTLVRRLETIDAEVLDVPEAELEDVIARFENDPRVEYVEPDYVVHASAVPNDPSYGALWGMAMIQAPLAWDVGTGTDVLVGVIDTGVDYNHPDLAANMWTNPGEIPGNGIDDDANGYVDDVHGYDWVNDDGDPADDDSHGTHVAGTIAAVGNNATGVVGVNWNARIMALKFLDATGTGYTSDAILAIEYATMMGAQLTNNSWGSFDFSQALEDAIDAAAQANRLFVAAAGNDGIAFANYPAQYDHDNIVSVAATDESDLLASFSNYHAESVDLGAPGVNILSTYPGASYASIDGTSMASPHVAGTAALIWSLRPDLSTEDVKEILLSSVSPNASLAGMTVTGGRLNAYQAMMLASGWVPLADPDVDVLPGSLSFSVAPDGVTSDVLSITNEAVDGRILYWTIAPPTCGWLSFDTLSGRLPRGGSEAIQVTADAAALPPGSHSCSFDVATNDPDEPFVTVDASLSVSFLPPPQIATAPPSISVALETGHVEVETISIANLAGVGERNLHWSSAVQAPAPAWISLGVESGITAPAASSNVPVTLSTVGLPAGSYAAVVVVTSNDPDDPAVEIPVHLDVTTPTVGRQKLYLFRSQVPEIVRTDLDGGNPALLYGGVTRPIDGVVATGARELYWIEWAPSEYSIWRGDLEGVHKEIFVTGVNTASSLAIDEQSGHLYYFEQFPTKRIMRVNLDGTGLVPLVSTSGQNGYDLSLDLAGGKMYWLESHPNTGIWRANLDGSGLEKVVDGLEAVGGVAIDVSAGKMYYSEVYPTDRVWRANLDGSDPEIFFTGLDVAFLEIDVAGGKLYWLERSSNQAWRANLNATGFELLGLSGGRFTLDLSPAVECGNGITEPGEECDGGGCCTSSCSLAPSATVCRSSAGTCDLAESCDGIRAECPADAKSTTECRGSAGVCDVAEMCDGVSNDCPVDAKSTTECRGSAGVCDTAEVCDGLSNECPADGKSTTECRGSAGVCDVAETCDGLSNDCPADLKSTLECRGSQGVCDLAETCDGVGNDCPVDLKSTAPCRASAGACDTAEACDGTSNSCPDDHVVPRGTECRPAEDACDEAEACDGSTKTCPTDVGVAPTTGCTVNGVRNQPCVGVPGVDTKLVGTSGDDVMVGASGDDHLRGLAGNDILCGLGGHDLLVGDRGEDALIGGADDDVLRGQEGNDDLFGGDGDDLLDGGDGDDHLEGLAGEDVLLGRSGDDTLAGGDESDFLNGGAGFDALDGGAGDDTLRGHAGDDALEGGLGSDDLDGGAGTDTCTDANGDSVETRCE